MDAITIENVRKYFRVGENLIHRDIKTVLDNISFTVRKGQNVAIIGPNGCGKTTLLKTIATIYMPDEGTIKVFGQDIFKNTARARSAFSFVSPALNFQNKLTLDQTLRFFGTVLKKRAEYIFPFLKRMGIMHMMNKRLEGFSEGQRALVRLAIGLIKDPKILLLDEVMANLDIERKERVLEFVQEQDELRDLTILMIDHDPHIVDRLCDKIIILREGGTLYKVTTVKELLAAMDYRFEVDMTLKLDLSDREIGKISPTYRRYGNKVRFFAHDSGQVEDITRKLLKRSEHVLQFSTSEVSLKDVYYLMMEGELGKF